MSLNNKKPIEPVLLLIGALIAFIVGLFLNFVSLRFLNLYLASYKGYQIPEALIAYSSSGLFVVLAILIYYYDKNPKARVFSRNLLIIGIFPGLIGSILIYTGHSSVRQEFINYVLSLSSEFTVADANKLANMLSPDIGFWIAFVGLVLMGISAYMMSISKFSFIGLKKEDALLPDLKKFDLTDEVTMDALKSLWYCPNDNTKLMSVGSRIVPNPEFRVSKERVADNISNAVAMRKIRPELAPYVTSFAELLLNKSDKSDIDLVSTACSVCNQHFVSPKLSEWHK